MREKDYELTIDKVNINGHWMNIHWSSNIGFGEYTLYINNGKLCAQTECMDSNDDKQFTKQLFNKLIEMIEVVE